MSQPKSAESTAKRSSHGDRLLWRKHATVTIGLLLLPFLTNSMHAVPSSDDFCYAAQIDKAGYIDAIHHYYNNVNGRFFATALIVTLDTLFPISRAYLGIPLFFLALLFVAAIAMFRAAVPRSVDWPTAAILGMMFSVILMANASALSEVIYWVSGGATYLSVTAFTLLTLACFLALARRNSIDRSYLALTGSGLLFAGTAVGSMEAAGPVLIASAFAGAFAVRLTGRSGCLGLCIMGIGAAIALWFNLSSPGTAIRAETIALGSQRDFIDFIVIALRSALWTTQYLLGWASNVSVWIIAIALYFTIGHGFGFGSRQSRKDRMAAILVLAGLAILPYLAAFPMFYAYSVPHPVRAHTYIDALCIIFWLTFLIAAFGALSAAITFESLELESRRLSLAVFIAFGITIAGTSNYYHASLDMFRGVAYAREAAAQIDDVTQDPRRGETIVLARSRTAYAPTLTVSDITPDPRRWRNVCFAEYLGAYGVRTDLDPDDGDFEFKPQGWTDPDPQAIGRPRPVWP
jgi:hypothetical protein